MPECMSTTQWPGKSTRLALAYALAGGPARLYRLSFKTASSIPVNQKIHPQGHNKGDDAVDIYFILTRGKPRYFTRHIQQVVKAKHEADHNDQQQQQVVCPAVQPPVLQTVLPV